jgi:hypothetical protein
MPRLPLRFATSALVCAGLIAGTIATTGAAAFETTSADPSGAQQTSARSASLAAPLGDITSNGQAAIDGANSAIADARTITRDIASSGLTVAAASTVVSTGSLSMAVDKLGDVSVTPALMVPSLTADIQAETQSVRERTAALRGQLDAAVAKKAEEEAAAKAAAEAAAAQAAAEAAAAQAAAEAQAAAAAKAVKAPTAASAPAVNVNVDPASAQGIARSIMAASYGWGDDQFACLVSLWSKESGWRVNAANDSGAYGIPQALPGSKMALAGADWQTNPATQIAWGLGYIAGRYGNACGAWSHSQSVGWY